MDLNLNLIDLYRRDYASLFDTPIGPVAPIEEILEPWRKAKAGYLHELFGDNLILEKEIEFTASNDEMAEKIRRKFIYPNSFLSRLYSATSNSSIIDFQAAAANKFDYAIDTRDEKNISFPSGTKYIKVIKKLAEIYNIEGFEDFRIAHSQILNKKKLHGTLCLSIHPLDYLTMSDNDCGWSSCMSWKEIGCYRQGTVEMMNSDCVVVGYLKASHDMEICGETWNSKKWRSLFIVNNQLITHVKSYPYASEDLELACMDWLKELAPDEFFPDLYHFTNNECFTIGDRTVVKEFVTNCMYNDLKHTENNKIYATKNIFNRPTVINYSGVAECMSCGDTEIIPDVCYDEESYDYLLCPRCESVTTCDLCGERTPAYEIEEIDGQDFCQSCCDNRVLIDSITNTPHYDNNTCIFEITSDYGNTIKGYIFIYYEDWDILRTNGQYEDYFSKYTFKEVVTWWNSNAQRYIVREKDLTDLGREVMKL